MDKKKVKKMAEKVPHKHKFEVQMGPGPSHACECGATKNMSKKSPFKHD